MRTAAAILALAWARGACAQSAAHPPDFPEGRVSVDEAGRTHFTAGGGKRRYLILDEAQKARTLETVILLASQPRERL